MKEAHHTGYRLLSGIKNNFILKFSGVNSYISKSPVRKQRAKAQKGKYKKKIGLKTHHSKQQYPFVNQSSLNLPSLSLSLALSLSIFHNSQISKGIWQYNSQLPTPIKLVFIIPFLFYTNKNRLIATTLSLSLSLNFKQIQKKKRI